MLQKPGTYIKEGGKTNSTHESWRTCSPMLPQQNDNKFLFFLKKACLGKNEGSNTYNTYYIALLVPSIWDSKTHKMDFVLPRSRARAGAGTGFVLGVVTHTWNPRAEQAEAEGSEVRG